MKKLILIGLISLASSMTLADYRKNMYNCPSEANRNPDAKTKNNLAAGALTQLGIDFDNVNSIQSIPDSFRASFKPHSTNVFNITGNCLNGEIVEVIEFRVDYNTTDKGNCVFEVRVQNTQGRYNEGNRKIPAPFFKAVVLNSLRGCPEHLQPAN